VIVEMRPPQWPQKGRPAVTALPHRGHTTSDTRVCGTTPAPPPPIPAEGRDDAPAGMLIGCGAPPEGWGTYAGPTRAADGLSGFPQSIQNLDAASFSRPQKAQLVTRLPPAGKHPWGANIDRG